MRNIHVARAKSWCTDKDGNLLWEEDWVENILHDEGEQALLSAYFATTMSGYGPPPANLYVGLDNRVSLTEADTLTTVSATEPSTGGYARQALSTAGTGLAGQPFVISQPGAYYQAQSASVGFTATGASMGEVRNRFIATTVSGTGGKLILSLPLQEIRTITDGSTVNTALAIGLSE